MKGVGGRKCAQGHVVGDLCETEMYKAIYILLSSHQGILENIFYI